MDPNAHTAGATAVDYSQLSKGELTEVRFTQLTGWLEDAHAPTSVIAKVTDFVDAIAARAGFNWADRDADETPG